MLPMVSLPLSAQNICSVRALNEPISKGSEEPIELNSNVICGSARHERRRKLELQSWDLGAGVTPHAIDNKARSISDMTFAFTMRGSDP